MVEWEWDWDWDWEWEWSEGMNNDKLGSDPMYCRVRPSVGTVRWDYMAQEVLVIEGLDCIKGRSRQSLGAEELYVLYSPVLPVLLHRRSDFAGRLLARCSSARGRSGENGRSKPNQTQPESATTDQQIGGAMGQAQRRSTRR